MKGKTIHINKEIPVRVETDVFVAGGGPAGVAAAVAAARNGCEVFLAEGTGCFGGMGTASLIPLFVTMTDGVSLVAAGFCEEIMNRMIDGGCIGSWYDVRILPEVLKRIYDDIVTKAGVQYSFFTQVVDAAGHDGKIDYVVLHGKSGFYAVKAKIYIDCTGDADMAALAGAQYEKGDENGVMQPGTLCSEWAGIDWNTAVEMDHHGPLEQAFRDGVFSAPDRHIPGIFKSVGFMGNGSFGHAFGMDGTDERSLTEAIVSMRKIIPDYEKYYKNYLNGYENMVLVGTGSLMGVRETRRVVCDYRISLKDFVNRAEFEEDEIGRYCYPVDMHPSNASEEAYHESERMFRRDYRYGKGETYGIPYRILTPLGFDNLLVAGRCVSSDRYMLASIRVMPACFITGQAAGTAAAMTKDSENVRRIDTLLLRKKLREAGAYLPRYKRDYP